MIYVETSKKAKKTYNLRKNENVYFCIDDPNLPYKRVRGKGIVKIHEDIDFNVPIAEKIMVKYLGSLEHPMSQALLDMQRKGQSVVLEISPKYYSTGMIINNRRVRRLYFCAHPLSGWYSNYYLSVDSYIC